jgi:hypothetical protein
MLMYAGALSVRQADGSHATIPSNLSKLSSKDGRVSWREGEGGGGLKGETGGWGLDSSDAGNRAGQHTSADAGVHGGRMWAKSECDTFVRMLAYGGVC